MKKSFEHGEDGSFEHCSSCFVFFIVVSCSFEAFLFFLYGFISFIFCA